MVRKRMAWVLLPVLVLVFTGCPKKPPVAPPTPIEMESKPITPPPAPPKEVQQPVDVQDDMVEVDPLATDDLQELNRIAIEMGFNQDIHFELDQSDLGDTARERLAANARFLKAHPGISVTIEGHCDERGTNEYNLALGNRRATSAMDYMVSLGVPAHTFKTITYGEERPVCTESTEECWWRNRNAHMILTGHR